jgi:hypothetical protein
MFLQYSSRSEWERKGEKAAGTALPRQPLQLGTTHFVMYLTLAQSDFSTCEVSDALIKLGVPHGGHIPDIHCISPHSCSESGGAAAQGVPVRLCGPAYTVRMVFVSDCDAPKLQQGHFVDLAPEGSVAFVSAPSGWSVPPLLRSSSYTACPCPYSSNAAEPLCPTLSSDSIHFDSDL